MKELLEKNNSIKPAQIGRIIEGKIIAKEKSAVFLDLGPVGTGIIYGKEFQQARETLKGLKKNDVLMAKITSLENEEGYIELSLNQASSELTWDKLKDHKERDQLVKVKITGANKGGLLAEVFNIQAFLPVSQLLPENYPRVEKGEASRIVKELQKFIGQEMEVKIFSLNKKEKKLVLSEKAKRTEEVKEILKNYNINDVVEGKISGITNFGVFIKFNEPESGSELEGLIHISELDWQLIEDPADVVKVGETVKAKIISIVDNKISLSLKQLKKDPWQDIETTYKKDDQTQGKVTKINPFGCFIEITPQIQGLCHISEFETKEKMEEQLKIGKKYQFQILAVDSKERRISLKLIQ